MRILLVSLLLLLISSVCTAQNRGLESGSLVIVGGCMRDLNILRELAELAGGSDAPVVVIPTAGGSEDYDEFWQGLNHFRAAGLTKLKPIHTYERAEADTAAFAQAIREARGV